jgi:hypothetical protein
VTGFRNGTYKKACTLQENRIGKKDDFKVHKCLRFLSFFGLSDCLQRILFVLASLIGDIERRRGWPSDALYGGGGTQESFPYCRF